MAYCPKCGDVRATKISAGHHGLVDACPRCDNVMLYRDAQAFVEAEHERVMRMVRCDHVFGVTDPRDAPDGICNYCECREGSPLAER